MLFRSSEIFQGLMDDGVAILNADDDYFEFCKNRVGAHRVLSFAIDNEADVVAKNFELDDESMPTFTLQSKAGSIQIKLPLRGFHNIYNALAASCVLLDMGFSLADIKSSLESIEAVDKRLVTKHGVNGSEIIDDSYNANPQSVKASIDVLANSSKDKIMVLGSMTELGEEVSKYHVEVGAFAKQKGISHVFCYGDFAKDVAGGFGNSAYVFSDKAELIENLKPLLTNKTAVLVKGSNSMKMWEVVNALIEEV